MRESGGDRELIRSAGEPMTIDFVGEWTRIYAREFRELPLTGHDSLFST